MIARRILAGLFGTLLLACPAVGQVNPIPPFYNRGAVVLYSPQIDVVFSGALLDARPTVSRDRKYVTIGASPRLTQLVDLRTFPVVMGDPGFVGGLAPAATELPGPDPNISQPIVIQAGRGGSILAQRGMTRISGQ